MSISQNNVVIAEYLMNLNDLQHPSSLPSTDLKHVLAKLAESTQRFDVPVKLLTNFDKVQEIDNVEQIKMPLFDGYLNLGLYFHRWEICYNYLLNHSEIAKAALVDVGDVEMLNYPFNEMQDNLLYFGDEPNDLGTSIISADNKPAYMSDFLSVNQSLQVLNPGVIAGNRAILLEYLGLMVKLLTDDQVSQLKDNEEKHLGNFEMALMNYVAYRYFSTRLRHGRRVSTRFSMWDRQSNAWFKHK